jgi:hypothetical protein
MRLIRNIEEEKNDLLLLVKRVAVQRVNEMFSGDIEKFRQLQHRKLLLRLI